MAYLLVAWTDLRPFSGAPTFGKRRCVLRGCGRDDEGRAHLAAIARSSDVTCVLVYDALEQSPPPPGMYRFSDGRHLVVRSASSADWRRAYEAHFAARVRSLESLCRQPGLSLTLMRTDGDAAEPLRKAERRKRIATLAGRSR